MRYHCKKAAYDAGRIAYPYICFSNGDYVQLSRGELCEFSVRLYDRLVLWNGHIVAVGESGCVRIKLRSGNASGEDVRLYNREDYQSNRRKYLRNRLLDEGDIVALAFPEDRELVTVVGNMHASEKVGELLIEFVPQSSYGSAVSDEHYIYLGAPEKEHIFNIDLCFENCEDYEIFQNEISDIQLVFSPRLIPHYGSYRRQVVGGNLTVTLDDYFSDVRRIDFLNMPDKAYEAINKYLYKRLYHRSRSYCDICDIHISYRGEYGMHEEAIDIPDIRPIDYYYKIDTKELYDDAHVSGYARKMKDGSAQIIFGECPDGLMPKPWSPDEY